MGNFNPASRTQEEDRKSFSPYEDSVGQGIFKITPRHFGSCIRLDCHFAEMHLSQPSFVLPVLQSPPVLRSRGIINERIKDQRNSFSATLSDCQNLDRRKMRPPSISGLWIGISVRGYRPRKSMLFEKVKDFGLSMDVFFAGKLALAVAAS
jgi:hypothetical protein